ncbi:hypothetical protein IEU95_06885 [Hoyosella rhizosphaerae]|uniref:YncE family protein n=1 Tax=Hoyosella rhizosphaerae TaxID=1755582 RepID=A0A916X9Z2_9ACTN|nr:hypothetical protein [Hoyosella rhizosphaerae]MBN4926547.1 hypothetical protein [Hoyosella rhizosphaerae]GGC58397.1 hypothetical protein GCM10011410_08620 [Hoyosella rhizosphaerae]
MRHKLPALALGFAVALTGCSSNDGPPNVQTVPAATAEQSPALSTQPDGVVVPLDDNIIATHFDATTESVVLLTDTSELLIGRNLASASPTEALNFDRVALHHAPASLALDNRGNAYVAAGNEVIKVDLSTSETTPALRADTDVNLTSIALTDDSTAIVGTENGHIYSSPLPTSREPVSINEPDIRGLVGTDVLVATGGALAALDRQQSMIVEVFPDRNSTGFSLRAGNGASTMIADEQGRILVANTRDGELLVYSLDRLILRQRYPVADSPYGIAYDAHNDLAWVTQTGRNEVAAYSLATGIPEEVVRYSTVEQPNSVTIDTVNKYAYISSAIGGGVQRIPLDTAR